MNQSDYAKVQAQVVVLEAVIAQYGLPHDEVFKVAQEAFKKHMDEVHNVKV